MPVIRHRLCCERRLWWRHIIAQWFSDICITTVLGWKATLLCLFLLHKHRLDYSSRLFFEYPSKCDLSNNNLHLFVERCESCKLITEDLLVVLLLLYSNVWRPFPLSLQKSSISCSTSNALAADNVALAISTRFISCSDWIFSKSSTSVFNLVRRAWSNVWCKFKYSTPSCCHDPLFAVLEVEFLDFLNIDPVTEDSLPLFSIDWIAGSN